MKAGQKGGAVISSRGGVRDWHVPPPKASVVQTASTSGDSFLLTVGEASGCLDRVDTYVLTVPKEGPLGDHEVVHVTTPREFSDAYFAKARMDVGTSRYEQASVAEVLQELVIRGSRVNPLDCHQL